MENQVNNNQQLKAMQSISSQKAQVQVESSAFEFQSEAISVEYTWDNITPDEKSNDTSEKFGSKKTIFYLTISDCRTCDECNLVSLNLHRNSTEMSSFIETLHVECEEEVVCHSNKGLTVNTPLEIKHIYMENKKVNLKMTVIEKVDKWNSICSITPINHAEVLCRQMANAVVSIPPDVTLKTMTDERLFPAHKFVLKLRSSVFAAMFSGDFVENQIEKPIEIFEISGQVMDAMLAYIYCKPFDGWKKIAGKLAVAADMYNIQPLYEACVNCLHEKITIENAVNNFYYADLLNLSYVKLNIARFIVKEKKEIEQTKSWKQITEERKDWLEKQLSEFLSDEKNKDQEEKF